MLPKGKGLPAPLNCSIHVSAPLRWGGDRQAFMDAVRAALEQLRAEAPPLHWRQGDEPGA